MVGKIAWGDYPYWTRYSHGNQHGWRRILNGRLIYAFDGTDGGAISWLEPYDLNGRTALTFEDAKRAAEEWALANPGGVK